MPRSIFKELGRIKNGFTLIELIVSLSIGLIGISISGAALLMCLKSVGYMEGSAVKNELALKVRRALSDRRSLKVTIEKNPILFAAFHSDYTGAVKSFGTHQSYGVTIFDGSGEALSTPQGETLGAPGAIFYYTSDGKKCVVLGAGKCRFKVSTSVLIQGLPSWDSYNNMVPIESYPPGPPHWSQLKPDFFHFHFTVTDVESPNSSFNLKPVSGSVFLTPEDVGIQ